MTKRFNMYQTGRLALILALVALPASLARAQTRCSAFHLEGAYGFTAAGFFTLPTGIVTTGNQVGVLTFDGAGKVKVVLAGVSSFGNIPPFTPFSGTYTVNADCTGLLAVQFSDTLISHAAFVLVDSRKTIYAIVLDNPPGSTLSLTFTKVDQP